jgi:hypothetical protein
MIISKHVIRRLKKYGIVPRTASGDSTKKFVKKMINTKTIFVKKDRKTGALLKINPIFTAVISGCKVVTIYPSNYNKFKGSERFVDMQKIQ